MTRHELGLVCGDIEWLNMEVSIDVHSKEERIQARSERFIVAFTYSLDRQILLCG
jgi:hypothetical protein